MIRSLLAFVLVFFFALTSHAITFGDRIKETTTTTGTGNITLAGASAGFRDINSVIGTSVTFPCAIVHRTAAEWELGDCALSSATVMTRSVRSSSNANALVNFSAGTKDVFVTPYAAWFNSPSVLNLDVTGVLRNSGGANLEIDELNIRGTAGLTMTTQSNGAVTLAPGGSGDVILRPGTNNLIKLHNNAATQVGTLDVGTFNMIFGYGAMGSNAGYMRVQNVASANYGVQISNVSAVGPTLEILRVSEAGTSSEVKYFSVYGDGAHGVPSDGQQAITISTGDNTTAPVSSHVELTCTTAPCTWKPAETSAQDGWDIVACNIDSADSIDVADDANGNRTVEVRGSPITLATNECVDCTYTGAIWSCR